MTALEKKKPGDDAAAHPLDSCLGSSCQVCDAHGRIKCHFRVVDLVHFWSLFLPVALVAGAGALTAGWVWLLVWLLIGVGFFGFLEIRVLCAHCPRYDDDGPYLRCWANWGMPKLWRRRPGPMTWWEKAAFLGGLAVVFGLPLVFLIGWGQWFRLVLYAACTAAFGLTVGIDFCPRCVNFACPLNRVDAETREVFNEKNPEIGRHWADSG
jgi:hypothetical protein